MSVLYTQKQDLKRGKLTIKGGWKLKIPEINLAPDDETAMMKFWIREGLTSKEAKAKIKRDNQRIYNTRYLMLIREWLGRKAEKYNSMFPKLGLEGFRPDIISKFFVPGRPRGGVEYMSPDVVHALTQMGRLVNDARRATDREDQGGAEYSCDPD